MPEVTFEGYAYNEETGTSPLYVYTVGEQARFKALAEKLNINIRVIWGAGMRMLLDSVVDDPTTLTIYDYTTLVDSPALNWRYLYENHGDTWVELKHRTVFRTSGNMQVMSEYHSPIDIWHGEYDPFVMFFTVAVKDLVSTQKKFDRYIAKYAAKAIDKEAFEKAEREREVNTKKAFLEYIRKLSGTQVATQRRRISDLQRQIADYQQSQITATQKLEETADRLEYLEQLKTKKDSFYEDQITHLLEHVDFKKVLYNTRRKSLELYTNPIWLYNPSRRRRTPLGEMMISFQLETRAVLITNLTNRRGGRDHPHVEGTKPCWGTVQPKITELAAGADLVTLFNYIVGYLESYNPSDSWGRYAAYWFDAQADTNEVLCEDNVYRNEAEKKAWEERGKTEAAQETEQTGEVLTAMLDTSVAAVSEADIIDTPQEN